MNKVFHLPKDKCPTCHYEVDVATPLDGMEGPRPNDFTICLICAQVLVFDDNLKFRLPTTQDLKEAPRDLMRAKIEIVRRIQHDDSI